MASHYYYLGAQLPYLTYGQNAPMSSGAFKSLAVEFLTPADAEILDFCTLDPDSATSCETASAKPACGTSSQLVDSWKKWERTLRLTLAKGRAQKLKRDAPPEVPDYPAEAVAAAKTALLMDSPLEAELYLDKARWDAIESFQGMNNFHKNAIYAYLLKLLLMERRAAFNAEEGFAEYKRLYAAILGEEK